MSRCDTTPCEKNIPDRDHPRWLFLPGFLPFVGLSLRASRPLPGLRLKRPAANDTPGSGGFAGEMKRLVPHFRLDRATRRQLV